MEEKNYVNALSRVLDDGENDSLNFGEKFFPAGIN